MTLIAALTAGGLPVMVGDIVISSSDAIQSIKNMPTWHAEDSNVQVSKAKRIVGLRQKLVLISDRLCVAWAGSANQADEAIEFLRAHDSQGALDSPIDALQAKLAEHRFSKLKLICFSIENGIIRVNSNFPAYDIGRFKNVLIEGSGRNTFYDLVRRASLEDKPTQPLGAITMAASLMCRQMFNAKGLEEGWGGGFEYVVWEDGKLRKIDNIMYLLWEFYEHEPGRYTACLHEEFMAQWIKDDDTIFWYDSPKAGVSSAYIVSPPWKRGNPQPALRFDVKASAIFNLGWVRSASNKARTDFAALLQFAEPGQHIGRASRDAGICTFEVESSRIMHVPKGMLPKGARVTRFSAPHKDDALWPEAYQP